MAYPDETTNPLKCLGRGGLSAPHVQVAPPTSARYRVAGFRARLSRLRDDAALIADMEGVLMTSGRRLCTAAVLAAALVTASCSSSSHHQGLATTTAPLGTAPA